MQERGNTLSEIPASGNDVRRFLPFTDTQTGRLNWPLPSPEKIDVHSGKYLTLQKTNEITAITAYGEYVFIYKTAESGQLKYEKLLVRNCLKYYDEWLFKFGFLRVHDSYIINIHYLEGRDGNTLILSPKLDVDISVSRSYRQLVEMAESIYRKP